MPVFLERLRRGITRRPPAEEMRAGFARDLVLALAALAAVLFAAWRFGFERIFTPGWWRP